MKVACTVRSGGKFGDNFKELPIAMDAPITADSALLARRRGGAAAKWPICPSGGTVRRISFYAIPTF